MSKQTRFNWHPRIISFDPSDFLLNFKISYISSFLLTLNIRLPPLFIAILCVFYFFLPVYIINLASLGVFQRSDSKERNYELKLHKKFLYLLLLKKSVFSQNKQYFVHRKNIFQILNGSFSLQRGDTPVHVAMRNDSKIICDTLVGDPNFTSQILHTENDAGETPYYLGNCNKQTIRAMDFRPGKVVIEQCQNISVTLLAILFAVFKQVVTWYKHHSRNGDFISTSVK